MPVTGSLITSIASSGGFMHISCFRGFAMPVERETKLVILGDEPGAVMEEIASKKSLGTYRLKRNRTQSLKDTYYDTTDRSLSTRGIALRIRQVGKGVIFCIKQDERSDESGVKLRDEIELSWSQDNREEIISHLEGISLPAGGRNPAQETPDKFLKDMGLSVIHKRETRRITLNAAADIEHGEGIIAEIALDATCYFINECRVLHHEIEVEAKGGDSDMHIVYLTDFLRKAYGVRLMPWDHNKLLTGLALERLFAEGKLTAMPGKTMYLNRSYYEELDALMRKTSS